MRAVVRPRYWHILLYSTAAVGVFGLADLAPIRKLGELPRLRWLAVIVPLLCGATVTLGAGGTLL